MTGPDSFFADDTIVLKVELAAANGEIQRLKAENERLETENRCVHLSNASLRNSIRSLCKWYEGQEGLREALAVLVACEGGKWDIQRYVRDRQDALEKAREALAQHKAAAPLWKPLQDCVGEG